jgi:hypothetical protein
MVTLRWRCSSTSKALRLAFWVKSYHLANLAPLQKRGMPMPLPFAADVGRFAAAKESSGSVDESDHRA